MDKLKIVPIVSENGFMQISYLCFDDKYMFMIDCGCGLEALNSAILGNGLLGRRLNGVLLTHCHFDHITGLYDVWKEYGCKIYIKEACEDFIYDTVKNVSAYFGGFKCEKIDETNIEPIKDGQVINMGNISILVISTQGHSLCSVCFQVGEYLFTGDTVLEGTVGRTDLFGGSREKLENSLYKISKMSYDIAFPGHGKPMEKALVDGIVNMHTN